MRWCLSSIRLVKSQTKIKTPITEVEYSVFQDLRENALGIKQLPIGYN